MDGLSAELQAAREESAKAHAAQEQAEAQVGDAKGEASKAKSRIRELEADVEARRSAMVTAVSARSVVVPYRARCRLNADVSAAVCCAFRSD